jgi:hypothetical protein
MSVRLLASVLAAVPMSTATPAQSHYPASWGEPPEIQTMDYVPLAGGYGHGSSSLSHWILSNIKNDISAGRVQYPPRFGEPPVIQTKDRRELPFGYGYGSGTLATWLTSFAKQMYDEDASEYGGASGVISLDLGSEPPTSHEELKFPDSWGQPPEIQTEDYVALAGGYGHGSSTLSKWILSNIQKDASSQKVEYPPAFGQPPLMQTRDYVQLPFGYGGGSGTLAKWLSEKAKEIYSEDASEFDPVV